MNRWRKVNTLDSLHLRRTEKKNWSFPSVPFCAIIFKFSSSLCCQNFLSRLQNSSGAIFDQGWLSHCWSLSRIRGWELHLTCSLLSGRRVPFCGIRHLIDFIVFSVPADFGKYPGTPSCSKGHSQSLHGPKWIFLKPRTTAPNASPSVDNYLASLEVCKTVCLPEKTLSVFLPFSQSANIKDIYVLVWNE